MGRLITNPHFQLLIQFMGQHFYSNGISWNTQFFINIYSDFLVDYFMANVQKFVGQNYQKASIHLKDSSWDARHPTLFKIYLEYIKNLETENRRPGRCKLYMLRKLKESYDMAGLEINYH